MRIYLDTCVWCRPFDNQGAGRIRSETKAFFEIASLVDANELEIVSSEALLAELEELRDYEKRDLALQLVDKACSREAPLNEEVRTLAGNIAEVCGLSGPDALQVASALSIRSEFFVTTDDFVTEKGKYIKEEFGIEVSNPREFVEHHV